MEPTEAKTIESLAAAIAGMGGISKGPKTKIGLTKWLYHEILNARNSGFSVSEILETLKNCGFSKNTTLNHFYGLMHKADIELGSNKSTDTLTEKPKSTNKETDVNRPNNNTGKNPLHKLSGKHNPGEFNPIPVAKIEFDDPLID